MTISYICRDCNFYINGAPTNPPRCPSCGSMYLLQDKSKVRKFKSEVRRIARLRKNREEPLTIYDRIFSAFFVVFITAMTLLFGPFLSFFFRGSSGDIELLAQVYRFILEWWPSMLFGAALIGFVFDIDRISNFFGFVWGTVKQNEEILVVIALFIFGVSIFSLLF